MKTVSSFDETLNLDIGGGENIKNGLSLQDNKKDHSKNSIELPKQLSSPTYTEVIQNATFKDKESLAVNILQRSQYYVPVKTGKLRDSVQLIPIFNGYFITYTAPYAKYVHEIGLNYHKPPTKYKFLEDAAYEALQDYLDRTGKVIDVKMTYDPLCCYVGCGKSAPGENILWVKRNEKKYSKNNDYASDILRIYNNFDPDNATDQEKSIHAALDKFFKFYTIKRHNSQWTVAKEFADRLRHGGII